MATGIQSSQAIPGAGPAAPNSAHQTTQQQSVATMEANQAEARNAKEVGGKTYHSFPGSSFFDKVGTRYEFDAKGELNTTNEEVQKELDAIADKPGCPIYFKNPRMTPAPGDDEPVKQLQDSAARAMAELKAQVRS